MIHLKLVPSRLPRLQAALTYFGICFLIGCLLGPIRQLFLVPALDYDRALAIEMILMLLISAAAARGAIRRVSTRLNIGDRLAVGAIALILLILAEEALAQLVSGESILDIWAAQSEQSIVVTAMIMLLFAAMPALVGPSEPLTVPGK